MFTWIQTTFKKHLPVFIVLLLVLLIIPFVFTIGNMPGMGFADRKVQELVLFGKPFTTEVQRNEFFEDSGISLLLASGRPAYDGNQLQAYGFRRAAALQMADKLGIPEPTEEHLTAFIKTLAAFTGPDGEYSPEAYTQFRDSLATNPQADPAMVNRTLRDDWRMSQVQKILGGPGYVVDDEVKQVVTRADTTWTVERATIDISNIKDETEPSEEEIVQHFEANAIRYRIPERVRADYAEFRASEFAFKVELTDEEITEHFEQYKSRYRPPAPEVAEGETPPPPVEPVLEDVRDKVVSDLTRMKARLLAGQAAADFAYTLFDKGITPGTNDFKNELAAKGIRLQSMPPVAANSRAPIPGWTAQTSAQIFALSESRPMSDPLQVGENTIIAFFAERIPSSDAQLEEVRNAVVSDLKANRDRQAVTLYGEEMQRQLTSAIDGDTTFSDAAEAAGFETKKWENFTLRELPQDMDYSVLSRIEELGINQVSSMAVQGSQGTIILVSARDEPIVDTASQSYREARENLMERGSALTAQGVLTEMVQRELVAAGLADAPQT